MRKLVFATNNAHKLEEVRAVLDNKIEIVSLNELGCYDDIPETADTLEGNALIKAEYVFNKFEMACIADDTGLEVEALNGEPGVYSARYGGEPHNAQKNMQKLLTNLKGIENRKARFRTVIVLKDAERELYFEGTIHGHISETPSGAAGFGYDPVFVPDGYNKSFAELGPELKNKISHRALAVEELIRFLKNDIAK
ncbi:MAG: non-canonical purine NTP diphosphatase [Paludibacter sp.]|nr:non-canonical purine NTP diphosphatase [Paludibacter sp.]MBP8023640.1 non-canonical purine NTP diphosphatase [Paludibacter sp.]MBP8782608.1 non-canonical purine NTP diphosphatase [Paludibacter sp.]